MSFKWMVDKKMALTIIVPSNFIDVFSYNHIWAFSLYKIE